MTTIISLLLLSTAAITYAIHELHAHQKLKWANREKPGSFWGQDSWQRKWSSEAIRPLAPDTFYYKLFDLRYKEAFPGSATIFVSVTDGPHLMQMVYLLCFSAAIAVHHETWWLWLLIYRAVFGVVFSIIYKVLGR
jgi:hypothetical protein